MRPIYVQIGILPPAAVESYGLEPAALAGEVCTIPFPAQSEPAAGARKSAA